jgi:predicted DNA-binding transcriptional regulator AlpA
MSPTRGLVGTSMAGELLGVTKQRVYQLIEAGCFPAPFSLIDGKRPVWLRTEVERFRLERNKSSDDDLIVQ